MLIRVWTVRLKVDLYVLLVIDYDGMASIGERQEKREKRR